MRIKIIKNIYDIYKNNKLNQQISYITNNVPFYFQFNKYNINLYDLPIIEKRNIRECYEKFLSLEFQSDIFKIINILNGNYKKMGNSYNEVYEYKDYIFEETTGTTGIPFRVVKTKKERIQTGYAMWKTRRCIDNYVAPHNFHGFNHIKLSELDWHPYNYDLEHIIQMYSYIERNKFRWIHISPTPLLKHIELLKNIKKEFNFNNLKYIECAGNFISQKQKALIESFFQVEIINQYGSVETWPVAQSVNKYNLFKTISEVAIIELVDDDNKLITDYNKIGNIVITTLNAKLLPFIRYRNGDLGKYVWHENNIYIELQKGRENNIIGGLSQKVWGNIFFHKVVQAALHKANMPQQLRYIQIQQLSDNEFSIEMNYFKECNKVVELIQRIAKYEGKEEWFFSSHYLLEDEMELKKFEKPNLFIRKYKSI